VFSPDDGFYVAMLRRGMSRRSFLKFAAAMAGALALPAAYAPRIAAAVAAAPRIPLIWLRGQSCSGNSEAFFQASNPTVSDLLLSMLSVEYHEAIMAPSGTAATLSRTDAMARYPNGYIAIIDGAIPTAEDGVYCTIGGRAFQDVVREVCAGALGTIAVGACAFDGGAPAATGGSTGAVGVVQVVSDTNLINLPGCPVNVDNLAATIVHFLTFKQFPVTDGRRRPLFAYGGLIHNQCERRAHFEFGEFVTAWGDEAAQKGWCLYKMGCKGPETFANCPTVKYADGASWAVLAGHGCIGCTMPSFWDAMGGAYERLPAPLPFAPNVSADQLGLALVGGVGGVTAVHGVASYVRQRRWGAAERREPRKPGDEAPEAEPADAEAEPVEPAAGPDERAAVAPAADVEPNAVAPVEPTAGAEPDAVAPVEPVEPVEATAGAEPDAVDSAAGPGERAAADSGSAADSVGPSGAPSSEIDR
jgi:hydrogenase small subunit